MKLFRKENKKYFAIMILLVCIDLISKATMDHLQISTSGSLVAIQLFQNDEVYQSLQSGNYAVILSMCFKTAILALITLKAMKSDGHDLLKSGLVIMLAGNMGNLINTLMTGGVVTDWIVVGGYIAFNFAGLYLLVGLILIAWQLFKWLLNGSVRKNLKEIIETRNQP